MSKEKFCNNPEDYRAWSRLIDRQWNQSLPPTEFAIIRFVFDRTAGWSKEWEVIPLRHFTDCVVSKKDGANYGGVFSASRQTIVNSLKSLIAKGALLRVQAGKSFTYSVNYEWNPNMKIPKRLKEGSKKWTDEGSKDWTHDGLKNGHKEKENKIPSEKGSSRLTRLTDEREEIQESLDRAKHRAASRREERKQDGYFCRGAKEKGGFVPTERALSKIWEDLHLESFSESPCAPLSKRSLHMVRAYCREWNSRNKDAEFVSDFLPWLFRNWSIVRKTSLSWMKDSPEVPQPMFVANAKMRPHLEQGWAKRVEIEAYSKLSPREREIAVLRSKGVDRDTAERMTTEKRDGEDTLKRIQFEQRRLEAMKMSDKPVERRHLGRAIRPSDDGDNNSLFKKLPSWDSDYNHQEKE